MESKEFIKLFNGIAQKYDFQNAFNGWFMESNECLTVLELQKSSFSKLFYLNIKTYIQGLFGNNYERKKELVSKDMGDILMRPYKEYDDIFDMETPLKDNDRKQKLEFLFQNFIVPYCNKVLSLSGIKELDHDGKVPLFPAVKKEIERLWNDKKGGTSIDENK